MNSKLRKDQPDDARERILLSSPDRLGDLVWTLPALDHIRQQYPSAHLSFLTSRYVGGLLEHHPQVDTLYTVERNTNDIRRFFHMRRLCKQLRQAPPQKIIFFKEGHVGRTLKKRFPTAKAWSIKDLPTDEREKAHASRVRMLIAENFCGPYSGDGIPRLTVPPAFQERANNLATTIDLDLDRCIILHPGVNRMARHQSLLSRGQGKTRITPRTWSPDNWIQLARDIIDLGFTPLFTGSGAETATCNHIADIVGPNCRLATNGLHPLELAGFCARARGLVAGDTGPSHLAAATATPVIALFGPTNPAITGPVAPPEQLQVIWHPPSCSPCPTPQRKLCQSPLCMEAITSKEVIEALTKMNCL